MDEEQTVESTDEGALAEEETISQGDTPRGFDPNKIRVKKIDLVVSNVMEKLMVGEIDLAPEFQRNKVWDVVRESLLIESLLIRIPLPVFYLDELPPEQGSDERYAVIDGVQRLTALQHFINDKGDKCLKLKGLQVLTQLEGKSFDDLDPALKRRILSAQLVAYAIEPGTPPEAKLNIFKRINTGGLTLTPQEIRHAMNGPDARKFLENLVISTEFIEAVGPLVAKQMSLRMADRECALRFIAFLDGGVERYRKSDIDLDGFLNAAMSKVNKMAEPDRQALAVRFRRAMRVAHTCFGRLAFRKPSAGGPLNKSLFEATAVALDGRSDAELALLTTRKEQLLEAYKAALAKPDIFASVTASTGDAKRVSCRFVALQSLIAEVIA
jgi:hypothetical protein